MFHEAERLVLNTIQSELPDELGRIFADHVASVNLVQRHWKDTEVNMYRKTAKKITFPEEKLPADKEETLLATIVLKSEDHKPKIAAKVWVVGGDLFQIKFNAPMKQLRGPYSVVSIKLGSGYLAKPEARTWTVPSAISDRWPVSDASNPLSDERRSDALKWIKDPLPQDFLDLANSVDGFKVGLWTVLGLESVYETPGIPDTYVLAEARTAGSEGTGLALISESGRIMNITMGELDEEPMGELGFIPALIEMLTRDDQNE